MGVVSGGRGVGGTVTLSTGLDPNNGVEQGGRKATRGGASAESSVVDVAPITPLLSDVLNTRSALVDDEVGRDCIRYRGGVSEGSRNRISSENLQPPEVKRGAKA